MTKKITVKKDSDHSLNELIFDSENVFHLVEEGSIDLYIKDRKSQKRTFLLSRKQGDLFFAIPKTTDYFLEGIANGNTLIKKIDFSLIEKEKSKFIGKMTNWIYYLYGSIFFIPNERIKIFLDPKKSERTKEVYDKDFGFLFDLRKKEETSFIYLDQGSLFLKGHKNLKIESPIILPITNKTWFRCESHQLSFKDFESIERVIEHPSFIKSMKIIHALIGEALFLEIKEKVTSERIRIIKKKRIEKDILYKTWNRLAYLLQKDKKVEGDFSENPLIRACQVLGKFSNFSIKIPNFFRDPKHLESSLNDIAEHSLLRLRKMKLEKHWWKKDAGNFLVFLKETDFPIPVVREKNHYQYFDHTTNTFQKVDETFAKKISDHVFSFFFFLHNEKPKIHDIFSFCFFRKKAEIFFQVLATVLTLLFTATLPWVTGLLFNRVIPFFDHSLLNQLALALFFGIFSMGILSFVSGWISLHLEKWATIRLQAGLWDKLLRLPISFFRKYTAGSLLTRVFSVSIMSSVFSSSFFSSLLMGLFSFVYLGWMFWYSKSLSIVGLFFVLIVALVFFVLFKRKIKIDFSLYQEKTEYNGFLLQVIPGIEKIRLTASENILFSRWGGFYNNLTSLNLSSKKWFSFIDSLNSSLPILGTFLVFFFGLSALTKESLSIGSFIAFNTAFIAFTTFIFDAFSTLNRSLPIILPLYKQTKEIMDQPSEEPLEKIEPGRLKGFLEIDNLYFRYDDSLPYILEGVSIKVDPGNFVAIVGPSGCGKSTLFKLLLKFHEPTSGSIYYDGNDLSDLDSTKVRKQLGVVLQDSSLMAGTIQENLSCGNLYTEKQIEHAMELSGFSRVMKELPMGLHTFIAEGGKNLSGGQKQQLIITRALLGNPKILLFDEATRALDNKTQNEIMEKISALKITRLVIAHRLSSVKNADRIYVLHGGKIVESGTFNELIKKENILQSWFKQQSL